MALPANVDTGLVTGRFLVGVIDGPDPDDDPDGLPAQGTITFTASVPYLPNPTADPAPVTILKAPIVGVLDGDGYLCVRGADGTAGARGVRLVATDDPDLSVQGWTWTATYAFENVNGVRPQIATHSMALPSGATVDLTSVVKVPSSTGIGVEQAEALAASAQAAAVQTAADVVAAREAAQEASTAAQPTDTGVATLITYGGETTTALDAQYRRSVTPAEFGAIGDGVVDDTAAVLAVIADGRPVHWGSGTYRITSPIEVTADRPTIWTAESAQIVADFPEVATYMLTIHAAGHDVSIRGPLTFDAAKHAHTCIRFWTRFARASLIAEDLRAVRAYRSVLALIGGDGIEVGGAWDRVHLTRPTVADVGMAVGAGASGSKGVSGIYVHEINKTGGADVPYDIRILQPMITDIYSEDPAWKVDQDGIRVFGAPEVTGGAIPTIAVIQGGEVRNSLGRGVKAQTPNVSVEGLKLVRDKGGQGAQYDIDFQRGGGTVTGIECEYRGAAPDAVVSASGNRDNSLTPQTVVSGVKVSLSGGATLPKVVWATSYAELVRSITVSDVIVKGGTPDVIALIAGVSDGKVYLSMSGIVASAGTSFVRIQAGSPNGWDLDLSASACINTGAPVPLVTTHTSLARIAAVSSALVRLT